jgi:stage V sporulation protein B
VSKDSLIKGTVILAVAALVARVLGIVQRVPLQHMLHDDGMATFGVAYNIYSMMLIVATAGIPSAISKLISERV